MQFHYLDCSPPLHVHIFTSADPRAVLAVNDWIVVGWCITDLSLFLIPIVALSMQCRSSLLV